MLITKEFLHKWKACWPDARIDAMGTSMGAADLVAHSGVDWYDKHWVICRMLVDYSADGSKSIITYATHCADDAEKSCLHTKYAGSDASYTEARQHAASARLCVDYTRSLIKRGAVALAMYEATNAAEHAAYAAGFVVSDVDGSDAYKQGEAEAFKRNLEFALTLLPTI